MGRYEDNVQRRKNMTAQLMSYHTQRFDEILTRLTDTNAYPNYINILKWIALYLAVEENQNTNDGRSILLTSEQSYVDNMLQTGEAAKGEYYSLVIKNFVDIPYSRIVEMNAVWKQSSHEYAKKVDEAAYNLMRNVESYKEWLNQHQPDKLAVEIYRMGSSEYNLKRIYNELLHEYIECSWEQFYSAVVSNDYPYEPIVWKKDYLMLYTLFVILYDNVLVCEQLNFTFDDFVDEKKTDAQSYTKWINPRLVARFTDIKTKSEDLRRFSKRFGEMEKLERIILS